MSSIEEKSLPLAIGLNLVLPGLGYMYMGKWIVGTFACLLILTMYLTTPLLFLVPTWIGINLFMVIDMLILSRKNKKNVLEASTKKCPVCAELIQKEAKVCRFCGAKFDGVLEQNPAATSVVPETSEQQIAQAEIAPLGSAALPVAKPSNMPIVAGIAVVVILLAIGIFFVMSHNENLRRADVASQASNVQTAQLQKPQANQIDTPNIQDPAKGVASSVERNTATESALVTPDAEQKQIQLHQTAPLASEAIKPSFDCAKASSPAERLICSSRELAALDVELAEAYKWLQSTSPDKNTLRKEQSEWIKNKRNICQTEDCMAKAYRDRIEDLVSQAQYLSKPAQYR